VGSSDDEMVKIAARIGLDAHYRKALREKIAANILTAPLFDTERFTRNFESAICMMVEASKNGEPLPHLDVADCHADKATSCSADNQSEVMAAF
jgi:protein O-GlcNAc transferase